MSDSKANAPRFFKTAWYAKAAKKAGIQTDELCRAIEQVLRGQADDLGGGVFKKRLNKNMHRSIVLGKGGKYWVYVYLYAKKDRENIEEDELKAFRELADLYAKKIDAEIQKELDSKELVEICQ
jgi:hypothetical protein